MKVGAVSGDMVVKLALLGAGLAGMWWVAQRLRDQIPDFGGAADWAANIAKTTLNPASDQNAVYQGANAAVSAAAGRQETVGGWLWETAHDGSLDPTSTNNLVYRYYNAVGNLVVRDPAGPGKNADGSWSVGGFVYDITH